MCNLSNVHQFITSSFDVMTTGVGPDLCCLDGRKTYNTEKHREAKFDVHVSCQIWLKLLN